MYIGLSLNESKVTTAAFIPCLFGCRHGDIGIRLNGQDFDGSRSHLVYWLPAAPRSFQRSVNIRVSSIGVTLRSEAGDGVTSGSKPYRSVVPGLVTDAATPRLPKCLISTPATGARQGPPAPILTVRFRTFDFKQQLENQVLATPFHMLEPCVCSLHFERMGGQ